MIYICIPAYNEEQTVGVVLWKIRQVMAELQRDYQLIVADDASTDRTQDVLEPYTRVLPLTVLRNEARRGYAASLEMLLREAVKRSDYPKRDVIIPLQADFTQDPAHVELLVKRIEAGADIVATNTLPQRNASRRVRWRRPILNAVVRRLGWPEGVRDPLNGYNAYRVLSVRRAIEERKGARLLRLDGWTANAQLLKESTPHARRVDVVELQPHGERRQRESRFLFMPALKQAFALRRGREDAGLLPVEQLRAACLIGGPSSQRSLVAESLRDSNAERPRQQSDRAAAPRRGRNGSQRADRDGVQRQDRDNSQRKQRDGGQRGQREALQRDASQGRAARGEQRTRSGPRGEGRGTDHAQPKDRPDRPRDADRKRNRPPRPVVPRPAGQDPDILPMPSAAGPVELPRVDGAAEGGVAGGAVLDEGRAAAERTSQGEGSEVRRRRPRRGRRGAGRIRPTAEPGETSPGTADGGASPPDGTSELEEASGAEGAARRRRRSNRRGGRGRRRRPNGEAGATNPGSDTEPGGAPENSDSPVGSADLDPPAQPESTPKAS